MPRVICSLPNASDEIDGIRFHLLNDGRRISDEISEAAAARYASINGYEIDEDDSEPEVPPPPPPAPKLTKAQEKAAKAAAEKAAKEAAKADHKADEQSDADGESQLAASADNTSIETDEVF